MVTTIQESLDYFHEITEELNELAAFDQYEMYRRLIDLGNEITAIPEAEKVEENFVKGLREPGLHRHIFAGRQNNF
jgi:sulfur transfer protein SufE